MNITNDNSRKLKRVLRKTYRIQFGIPRVSFILFGKRFEWFEKYYCVHYQQATIGEIYRFQERMTNPNITLIDWTVDFICDHCLELNGKNKWVKFHVNKTQIVPALFKHLYETYCGEAFRTKVKVEEKEEEETIEEQAKKYFPKFALFAWIMRNTPNTLEDIMNMTWEMLDELREGIEFINRQSTKEGQEENEKMARRALLDDIHDEDQVQNAIQMLKDNFYKQQATKPDGSN